jgi:hypothetical protein
LFLRTRRWLIIKDKQKCTSWKTVSEQMTGIVVISEVDAFMYVVLSKVEKHVPYRELIDTTEYLTV